MTTEKQRFMAKPKIAKLRKKEQERRWRQHQASRRADRMPQGYSRNTRMKAVATPKGHKAELMLSSCSKEYFLAMQAPFSLKQTACVPDLHSVPSKKVRLKTKGTVETGTDGNGFIMVCPWCNSSNGGFVKKSSATNVYPKVPPVLDATVATDFQSQLPYVDGNFNRGLSNPANSVQARTVMVGIRIRYVGPAISRGGQITALRHPDNEDLMDHTYEEIKNYQTAKTYSNKAQWIYTLWRPTQPSDYEYSVYPNNPATNVGPYWSMGFTIQGTSGFSGAPGTAKFEYEVIRYVEYIGRIDNVTRSHVDLAGMSHIRNSLGTKSSTDKPHTHLAHAIKRIEDDIGESLPAVAAGAYGYSKYAAPTEEAAAEGGESLIGSALESLSTYASSLIPEAGEVGATLAEVAPFLI